ncbi:MAG: protein kinase [Acidobacteria bacterium]|nr:protein kinase [Acidobacteriota bacterium]MBV9479111.1 protein kinase [Acidobacteriota bacterium]
MSTVLDEIAERFDVLAKLGEGGMGCVYKVRHRDLDEVQIVKTLQAHLSTNEGLRTRFINEARRGMRLRHPHIAGVHDFHVCADGTGYIVMEYVHGLNLRDLVSARGPLRVPLVGAIALQTLDALGYLHSQKFVHRDISPDNLILTQTADGHPFVKLIDLGISKSLDEGNTMTQTGQFLGKVAYASPEQFGGHVDGRSDLYSFGVVLYKLLTNEEPFAGENYREIISAHLFQKPRPFPPELEIPDAVQQVVFRALENEPAHRYADAHEFADAVEEAFGVQRERTTRPALERISRAEDATLVDGETTAIDTTVAETSFAAAPTIGETVVARPRASRRWPLLAAIVLVLLVAGALVWQRMHAAALARYGNFYAVVIGEGEYRKFEALPTAVDDARAVAQLLESRYGFHVTRLENAKQQEILAALNAVGKQLTPADNLLVFYAGHGSLLNGKGYWQPVDAGFDMTNWISPALVKDALLDHPARRALVIADTCYSGALVHGALATLPPDERLTKRARLVLSSGGTAPVIDSADGRHSIFTRALLDVLGERGRGVTDVQSIFTPIEARVIDAARRDGHEQKPELAAMAEVGDEGGTFYFVRR